jgi:serine/threonine protein kinase
VAFLHQRGILHRDLKPSNILLASIGDPQPLVCDFGLAGRLDEADPEVAGTPPYMAPEQMEGLPPTAAADVWSLGAVLYELLTGRPPFSTGEGLDHEGKRSSEPPPPRRLNAAVDETLERICLGCLRREPLERYPTAAGLAADLERYLEIVP